MARQFRSDDTSPWLHGFGYGSDGAKTISSSETYDGAKASCSGSSGSASLTIGAASTFADGDMVVIIQLRGTGVGAWELNRIISGGGTTSLTLEGNLQNTYTDSGSSQAQIVEMKQYSSVTVNSSQTWSAPTWGGDTGGIIAFFCTGTFSGSGTIALNGKGYQGGPIPTGTQNGQQGEGTSGAGTTSTAANGSGGGGGEQGGIGAGGGGGGHAASGSTGSAGEGTPGTGGGTSGVAGLTTMTFGGGGGAGKSSPDDVGTRSGGGEGGGILIAVARNIDVSSMTTVNGNGTDSDNATNRNGKGGGGAGGSVLLKGQTVILGTNKITVAGGVSGTGGTGGAGGTGSVGRIHADYLTSISGSTSPTIDSRQDTTLVDPPRGGALFALM